ncbi:MAG: hypothetical protein ABFS34_11635 [Gemmatimonadota bacterium]
MQTSGGAAASAGFVQANPLLAFGLLAAGSLLLAMLPVAVVRRFLVIPHAADTLLVIEARRWLRVLVMWVLPALVAAVFWIAVRVAVSLADVASPGAPEWGLALAFGLVITLPLAGIAYAVRALFLAAIRATEYGLFLQGSLLRWADISAVRRTRSGVVLETPASALIKRRSLRALGWELSDQAIAELERLRERGAG